MKKIILFLSLFLIPEFLYAEEDLFCFSQASQKLNISEKLLKSISFVESSHRNFIWNKNKDSIDVCHMQINSFWFKYYDPAMLLNNPCYCTFAGASILKDCFNRYGYNWNAIACYNSGTSFDKNKISKRQKFDLTGYILKVKKQMEN